MNYIFINPEVVDFLEQEGIKFFKNTFIEIQIDGFDIKEMDAFEDGTVYWPELKRTIEKTGKYLIFTCVCGIAEDAGWEEINVVHSDSEICWEFERNGFQIFKFDKAEYIEEIKNCETKLNLSEFPLAVESAVFPTL